MRYLLLLVLATFLSGCATTGSTKIVTNEAEKDSIQESALRMLDAPGEMYLFEVHSHGAAADGTFISMSKSIGPAKIAKQFGSILSRFHRKDVSIVVFGPNSRKTARVTLDALKLAEKKDLSKMNLIFCGLGPDFKLIQENSSGFKGKLLFLIKPGHRRTLQIK